MGLILLCEGRRKMTPCSNLRYSSCYCLEGRREEKFCQMSRFSHRDRNPVLFAWKRQPLQLWQSLNTFVYAIQGIHKRMVRFQKLTRNLFLTLHGHNLHCQQRQLSSFSCATSSSILMLTAGPRGQFPRWRRSRKRLCVFRFEVSRSVITVQSDFRAWFRKDTTARCGKGSQIGNALRRYKGEITLTGCRCTCRPWIPS
jgi:hypothetical protein